MKNKFVGKMLCVTDGEGRKGKYESEVMMVRLIDGCESFYKCFQWNSACIHGTRASDIARRC
jgi:hypothetical protein